MCNYQGAIDSSLCVERDAGQNNSGLSLADLLEAEEYAFERHNIFAIFCAINLARQ